MTVEKDVNFVPQAAGANVFIAQVGVWDLALVQRVADPADGICVRPRNPESDARRGSSMMGHLGNGGSAGEIQAKFRRHLAQFRGQAVLRRKNPGAGGKFCPVQAKSVLRDLYSELAEAVTRRQHGFLPRVL